ncbi:MAG TPA: CDP-glucose 4,6-dehydratase [Alphaproteobacteria bacterium]|nr:CDP-glucose 4,6-dehydratase [Alphaproteobacteria bacterium]
MNPGFWKNKKILLTGHTGFKGSWLSLWLQQLGADLVGVSLPPEGTQHLFGAAQVADHMTSIFADIRDAARMKEIMAQHKPQIVLHLAAQALVRRSYHEPVYTYETNVMGTLNILEAIRAVPSVQAAVMVTTDKCYENRERAAPYREDEALGGYDPYSSSKACAELVTAAYRNSFFQAGARIATARAGNVIGGGDWSQDRLIPDIIAAFESNNKLVLRNPKATRPWQHVLESLSGYLNLAEKLYAAEKDYTGAWNFGPDISDVKPVEWIVDCISSIWGKQLEIEIIPDVLHEAGLLALDSRKAQQGLNWHPVWRLEQALAAIVDWAKAKDAVRDRTLRQIADYQATLLAK